MFFGENADFYFYLYVDVFFLMSKGAQADFLKGMNTLFFFFGGGYLIGTFSLKCVNDFLGQNPHINLMVPPPYPNQCKSQNTYSTSAIFSSK